MTDRIIPHNFGAVPAPNRAGWHAWFLAPGIGIRWLTIEGMVTRENGKPVKQPFKSEERALIAAARAQNEAEDMGRAPLSASARVFAIHRNGRNVRTEAVGRAGRR